MSKVEVNQVTQQCGTTLTVGGGACKTAVVDATTVTLGRCGGTVSLASGATQSGFGRTGTVDWITTPKVTGDSPVTAVTGKGYFLNTTAGTITVNLPAGAAGSIVSLADYAATWQTNAVTVTPNGTDKIGSLNVNASLTTEGQSVTFVYVDATQGWINTMDSTSNVRGTTFITATGGCITTCGLYKMHTFFGPGTLCVSAIGTNAPDNVADYLVVAGGGGSGNYYGAAGGAGGFRESPGTATGSYTVSSLGAAPAVALPISVSPYAIVVGGGGAAGSGTPANTGTNGTLSSFSTITSAGGGGGSGGYPCSANALPGGSGGGAGGYQITTKGTGNVPPVSPSQGFPGGGNGGTSEQAGAGGALAAALDTVWPNPNPALRGSVGGIGAGTAINLTTMPAPSPTPSTQIGTPGPVPSVRYFSGGGSGVLNAAPAGGGGGAGNCWPAPGGLGGPGTINTGGGAGSEAYTGGSGIIVIRYRYQ